MSLERENLYKSAQPVVEYDPSLATTPYHVQVDPVICANLLQEMGVSPERINGLTIQVLRKQLFPFSFITQLGGRYNLFSREIKIYADNIRGQHTKPFEEELRHTLLHEMKHFIDLGRRRTFLVDGAFILPTLTVLTVAGRSGLIWALNQYGVSTENRADISLMATAGAMLWSSYFIARLGLKPSEWAAVRFANRLANNSKWKSLITTT